MIPGKIAKMMKSHSVAVAARIGAHPSEVLQVMHQDWARSDKSRRKLLTAELATATARG